MIIVINTKALPDDYPEEYKYFIYEILKRITSKNPDHKFIFIVDKKNNNDFNSYLNVQQIIAGPSSRHFLLRRFWFGVKISALLKKHKADVFVSFDGICSLSATVPQCLVLQNLFFDNFFIKKSQSRVYKKYILRFLDKAKSIAVTTDALKQKIINQYKTNDSKIDVVFGGRNKNYIPINEEDKKIVKEKYTDGKEYFLYAGTIHPSKNLLNLVKAFSVFKKRQQTNMKLMLVGNVSKNYQSFKENLKFYRYRKDVILIENSNMEELIKITGAAHAFINVSQQEGFNTSAIEAMQCDIPVIIADNCAMQEITNDAVLYVDASSYISIADKMMLIYKDENLHKELIEKGKLISEKYSWDETAELVWKTILKAADKNS